MSGINSSYLALFGASSGSSVVNPAYPAYQRLLKSGTQDYQSFLKQPQITSNLAYVKSALPKITSAADLVKDTKLLNIVLTAFGLQSDAQYPARIKQVLDSNLKDQASLANQLLDPRYQQLAKFFNFNVLQGKNLSLQSFAQDLSAKYTQSAYEVSLGQQNPALRSASYFEQNIGNVKNVVQILGDTVLREVVFTALGIPSSISSAPIDQQIAYLNTKLNLSQLTGKSADATTTQNQSVLTNATNDLAALGKFNGTITTAIKSVQPIATQTQSLLAGYNNLANITSTSGPYGPEIPTQQTAVPGLTRQQGLLAAGNQATAAITSLTTDLASAITQAQAGGLTGAQLTALQTQFSTDTTQANTLTTQATYGGENLIDGSIAAPISVQITSTGQSTVINPYNLNNGVLDNLASANSAFQIGDYTGASTFLQAAQASLAGTTQQLGIDATNFHDGIASVPQWAVTENDSNLFNATQTISSSQTAYGSISSLAGQILNIANQAATSGLPNNDPALVAFNTTYQGLLTQLQTAITGSGYSGQNLLDGSSILIGTSGTGGKVDIGNVLRTDGTTTPAASVSIDGVNVLQYANGGAGGANDLFNHDLTTTANAQSVVDEINNLVNPTLQQANATLANDNSAFTLVSQTLDPRSSLDNQYRALVTSATTAITNANLSGSSLISTSASDQYLSVATTGQTLTAHADPNFVANVQNNLTTGSGLLYSNFAQALQSLSDATFFSNETLGNLQADQTSVNLQTSLVNAAKNAATPASVSNSTFGPFNNHNQAVQAFVAKYLVLTDAKGVTSGPTDAASVALGILNSITA
ncbi:MAG: DUF1217 domain-containing protein [Proteobacteria bacterium]|nr:DUF1217 domain-containing protein [Pseudomonadota bacterium]